MAQIEVVVVNYFRSKNYAPSSILKIRVYCVVESQKNARI